MQSKQNPMMQLTEVVKGPNGWRLCVDGYKQDPKTFVDTNYINESTIGWVKCEKIEKGTIPKMLLAYQENYEQLTLLDQFKKIHEICNTNPSKSNNGIGSAVKGLTTFAFIQTDTNYIKEQLENIKAKVNAYKTPSTLKNNQLIVNWYTSEVKGFVPILFQKYSDEMPSNEVPEEQLKHIIQFCADLSKIHPFLDCNIRTTYIFFNLELVKYGFTPVIFKDPNNFESRTIDDLYNEVLKGQQAFQKVIKEGIPYDGCLTNEQIWENIFGPEFDEYSFNIKYLFDYIDPLTNDNHKSFLQDIVKRIDQGKKIPLLIYQAVLQNYQDQPILNSFLEKSITQLTHEFKDKKELFKIIDIIKSTLKGSLLKQFIKVNKDLINNKEDIIGKYLLTLEEPDLFEYPDDAIKRLIKLSHQKIQKGEKIPLSIYSAISKLKLKFIDKFSPISKYIKFLLNQNIQEVTHPCSKHQEETIKVYENILYSNYDQEIKENFKAKNPGLDDLVEKKWNELLSDSRGGFFEVNKDILFTKCKDLFQQGKKIPLHAYEEILRLCEDQEILSNFVKQPIIKVVLPYYYPPEDYTPINMTQFSISNLVLNVTTNKELKFKIKEFPKIIEQFKEVNKDYIPPKNFNKLSFEKQMKLQNQIENRIEQDVIKEEKQEVLSLIGQLDPDMYESVERLLDKEVGKGIDKINLDKLLDIHHYINDHLQDAPHEILGEIENIIDTSE